jgi:hypothetical protein
MKKLAISAIFFGLPLISAQTVLATDLKSSRKALIELEYERKEIETKAKISLSKIDAEEQRSIEANLTKSGFPKETKSERDLIPEHQLMLRYAKITREANLKHAKQRVQTRRELAVQLKKVDIKIAELRYKIGSELSKSTPSKPHNEYVLSWVASRYDEKIEILEATNACLKKEAEAPSTVVDKRIADSASQFSALSKQSQKMAEDAMEGGSLGEMMLTAQSLSMHIPFLMEMVMPEELCKNSGVELREKHELKRLKLKRDVSLQLADQGLEFDEPPMHLFFPNSSDYLF